MKTKSSILVILLILAGIVVACNNSNPPYTDENENEDNDTIVVMEPTLCYCIMDTLQGNWAWIKRYGTPAGGGIIDSEFKSIIKILSQNENASINYEIFVEDTLFHRGSFQYEYRYGGIVANIKLPHYKFSSSPWITVLGNQFAEEYNKDFLVFREPIIDMFFYHYLYQKIK